MTDPTPIPDPPSKPQPDPAIRAAVTHVVLAVVTAAGYFGPSVIGALR